VDAFKSTRRNGNSGSDGLKLFLPRQHHDDCIYFQTDWSFVPPEVDAATVPADAPKLRLRLIGYVPGLRDWRDLENLFLGYHEPIDGKELPDTRGPDIWIWPPGETAPLRFGHWETDLKFGERHGHEFEFSPRSPHSQRTGVQIQDGLRGKGIFPAARAAGLGRARMDQRRRRVEL
jgi:hypothetical protein